MKTCTWLVISCCVLCACNLEPDRDLATAEVMNIGMNSAPLATAAVPPLGVGIAPIDGTGGDGAPAVPGRGPAEGAAGAIRFYGGQWLIPFQGTPGSTIQNVSCDVIPNASSTDLVELVGDLGVIGSVVVPATTGQVIRAWITAPHAVTNGETFVIRHSPRDRTSGAFTTGVQQITILGCAVNVSGGLRTKVIHGMLGVSRSGVYPTYFPIGGMAGLGSCPYAFGLAFDVGDIITAIRATVIDAPGSTVRFVLNSFSPGIRATSNTSNGSAVIQVLTAGPMSVVVENSNWYSVDFTPVTGSGVTQVIGIEIDYIPAG